jgi:hypothetical protein
MYFCEITGKLSKPGQKCHKVITHIAERVYTRMVRDEETHRLVRVEVGRGFEIVKEVNASEEGMALWNASHPNGPTVVVRPPRK